MEGELFGGVAIRNPRRASPARATGIATRDLDDSTVRVDRGSRARVNRTAANTGAITAGAPPLKRGPRRDRERRHDERAVSPPWPVLRMNLDPERARGRQARRLAQTLERKRRRTPLERVEQPVTNVSGRVDACELCSLAPSRGGFKGPSEDPFPGRPENLRDRCGDAFPGEVIEGIWRRVARWPAGRRRSKVAEERRPPIPYQHRAMRSRQQVSEARRPPRDRDLVESGSWKRQEHVETLDGETVAQGAKGVLRRSVIPEPHRRLNGYGVLRPSDGGKEADFTAASTQPPVGVPVNFPVTVADETLPLLLMTTLTIAMPGTLNCE